MNLFGNRNQGAAPEQPAAAAPAAPADVDSVGVPAIPSVAAIQQLGPAPMTSTMARNVRFNTSEPSGYYFPQVEAYVEQVGATFDWYENARYQMERALHDLQVECDHQTYDAQRLRTEIELFKVQGSPVVNADGSYKTESQQAAETGNAEHLAALEAQLATATAHITELEVEIARAHAYITTQDTQVAQFRAQAEAAITERDSAVASAQVAAERLAEAQARQSQTEQIILTLQQDNERLQVALTAAVDGAADLGDTPSLSPAQPEPVTDNEAIAVVPVESELPAGTVLPSQAPHAGYAPAAPGAPLASGGVPAHLWAPELGAPAPTVEAEPVDPDAVPQPSLHP